MGLAADVAADGFNVTHDLGESLHGIKKCKASLYIQSELHFQSEYASCIFCKTSFLRDEAAD